LTLFNNRTGKFYSNSVYIKAEWNESNEDRWEFKSETNPVVF